MRTTACIALLALLAASAAPAQVYRWVDEDGVVHYSDTPHPGAEELHLPETPTASPGSTFETVQRTRGGRDEAGQSQPFDYESLRVVSPAAEETLWNIEGQLTVRLDLQPSLRSGDQVRVYFDGRAIPTNGLQVELDEVWRGTHNLQAEVVNQQGELLIRSEPIRFYVHQTSIQNPN